MRLPNESDHEYHLRMVSYSRREQVVDGQWHVMRGVGWVVGGAVVSLLVYGMSDGRFFLLFWGAIAWGLWEIFVGARLWFRNRS